jgi:hypothetical protein
MRIYPLYEKQQSMRNQPLQKIFPVHGNDFPLHAVFLIAPHYFNHCSPANVKSPHLMTKWGLHSVSFTFKLVEHPFTA